MLSWARSLLLLLGSALCLASPSFAELVRGPEFLVNGKNAGKQGSPDVGIAPDGHFVVVWVDGGARAAPSNVMARIFTADGRPRTADFKVSASEPGFQNNPRVAMSADGGFVVVWLSKASAQGVSRVYGRLFRSDGHPLGQRFPLGKGYGRAQSQPDVDRTSDGRFVVAWTELDGRVFDLYSWPTTDVFVRRFSAQGKPRGLEFVADRGRNSLDEPAVTVNASGGFIVAWTWLDSLLYSPIVWAGAFSDAGAPISELYFARDYVDRSQSDASVIWLSGGERVAVWEDEEGDGYLDEFNNSIGIRGQRIAADGTRSGEAFHVNSTVADFQIAPSVVSSPNGGFVVTWTSMNQDGDGRGVFARSFAADAAPLGPEVQLNTYSQGNQSLPAVAMAPNGRGVAVWQSMRRDGDDFGVAARLLYVKPQ